MNKKATAIRIVAVVVVLVALAVGTWLLLRGCTPSDNVAPPPVTITATEPSDETDTPTTSTAAGSDTDEQPSTTTKTPVNSEPPVTTTEAPVTTTQPPVTTTETPVTTTETPVTTTKPPETTQPPVTTTPHTHSYSAWSTTKEASCTTKGTKTRICSCGDTQTESIAATGHSFGSWKTTTAATCVTAGTQSRTCAACGKSETSAINATGHSYGSWTTTKQPNCTTNGVKTRTCSSCKHSQEEAVAATGHKWDNGKTTVVPTTCSDMGIKTYTCTVCKMTRTEQIKGSHSFGNWQWEEATCTIKWTNGIITRDVEVDTHKKFHTCSKCKYKEYASFTPHECSQKVLNNDGNTTFTTIREATCAVPGIVRATCKVCGWYYDSEQISTDHTWEGRKFIHVSDYTEYTNELDAYTNKCTTCGYESVYYETGKGFEFLPLKQQYNVDISRETSYVDCRPVPNEFNHIEHPEWQTVIRNIVYDANGYAIQYDVIWWDVKLNQRCTDTVVVANVPAMFEEWGWDLSQYDLNKVGLCLVTYYGKLVPRSIAWSG